MCWISLQCVCGKPLLEQAQDRLMKRAKFLAEAGEITVDVRAQHPPSPVLGHAHTQCTHTVHGMPSARFGMLAFWRCTHQHAHTRTHTHTHVHTHTHTHIHTHHTYTYTHTHTHTHTLPMLTESTAAAAMREPTACVLQEIYFKTPSLVPLSGNIKWDALWACCVRAVRDWFQDPFISTIVRWY